jgi:hypothetical protein
VPETSKQQIGDQLLWRTPPPTWSTPGSTHGVSVDFSTELEREAGDDEGREEDRQKALSRASEGDRLAFGGLEGPSSTGVSATANFQGVTSGFNGYLDRVVHLKRSDALTVDHDVVRTTPNFDSDCFVRHLQGRRHHPFPLLLGRGFPRPRVHMNTF